MKRAVVIFGLAVLACQIVVAEDSHTFYIQLVRGSDTEKPPEPGCRHAGPRLAATFQPVFKWKSYWQISLREATLAPGHKTRVRLSPEREVEIDLRRPQERRITALRNGKVTDQTIAPAGDHMTIIGGKRSSDDAYFIVVRRDKPKD